MGEKRHPALVHLDRPDIDRDHRASGPKLGGDTDRCEQCDAPVKIELRSRKSAE